MLIKRFLASQEVLSAFDMVSVRKTKNKKCVYAFCRISKLFCIVLKLKMCLFPLKSRETSISFKEVQVKTRQVEHRAD